MTQGNNGGVVHIESMDPDSVRSMEARITDMEHGMRKIATTAVDTEAPPPMQPMPAELRGRTKKRAHAAVVMGAPPKDRKQHPTPMRCQCVAAARSPVA